MVVIDLPSNRAGILSNFVSSFSFWNNSWPSLIDYYYRKVPNDLNDVKWRNLFCQPRLQALSSWPTLSLSIGQMGALLNDVGEKGERTRDRG